MSDPAFPNLKTLTAKDYKKNEGFSWYEAAGVGGLTKREFFAMKTLEGLVSTLGSMRRLDVPQKEATAAGISLEAHLAKSALKFTEAMLLELNIT